MYSPCITCTTKYTEECKTNCEFVFCMDIFKKVLQINDGCIHCKNWNSSDGGYCNRNTGYCSDYSSYELDINKLISDYFDDTFKY